MINYTFNDIVIKPRNWIGHEALEAALEPFLQVHIYIIQKIASKFKKTMHVSRRFKRQSLELRNFSFSPPLSFRVTCRGDIWVITKEKKDILHVSMFNKYRSVYSPTLSLLGVKSAIHEELVPTYQQFLCHPSIDKEGVDGAIPTYDIVKIPEKIYQDEMTGRILNRYSIITKVYQHKLFFLLRRIKDEKKMNHTEFLNLFKIINLVYEKYLSLLKQGIIHQQPFPSNVVYNYSEDGKIDLRFINFETKYTNKANGNIRDYLSEDAIRWTIGEFGLQYLITLRDVASHLDVDFTNNMIAHICYLAGVLQNKSVSTPTSQPLPNVNTLQWDAYLKILSNFISECDVTIKYLEKKEFQSIYNQEVVIKKYSLEEKIVNILLYPVITNQQNQSRYIPIRVLQEKKGERNFKNFFGYIFDNRFIYYLNKLTNQQKKVLGFVNYLILNRQEIHSLKISEQMIKPTLCWNQVTTHVLHDSVVCLFSYTLPLTLKEYLRLNPDKIRLNFLISHLHKFIHEATLANLSPRLDLNNIALVTDDFMNIKSIQVINPALMINDNDLEKRNYAVEENKRALEVIHYFQRELE